MIIKQLKNRLFPVLLMAICTGATLMASCSDDDKDEKTGTEETEQLTPGQQRADELYWKVNVFMQKLTGQQVNGADGIDISNKTFEPVIGEVRDNADPFNRSVWVEEPEMAEDYFLSLIGQDSLLISKTADGYVINLTNLEGIGSGGQKLNLGTLTYHRASDGSCVGYADIDMPCIPHLQRISYKTKDQWGDNADWEVSPAKSGQVYRNGSLYYLCVKESHGTDPGYLVCMEYGKGSDYHWYESETWGAWGPNKHAWAWWDAIGAYLNWCASSKNLKRKKKIKQALPHKIFPAPVRMSGTWTQWSCGDLDDGFGNVEDGWSHFLHFSHDYYVYIVGDQTEGDLNWGKWWRRFHYVRICGSHYGNGYLGAETYQYKYESGWKNFFSNTNNPVIYTAQTVQFGSSLPSGFALQDI